MKTPHGITSTHNAYFKKLVKLCTSSKMRVKESVFIAEGKKIVTDLVALKAPLKEIVVKKSLVAEAMDTFKKANVNLIALADTLFGKISLLKNSEGVLGICKRPQCRVDTIATKKSFLLILCENIQDPVNVGAIARTACCLGADALLLTKGSVDAFHPRAVRSSAGLVAHIPVIYVNNDDLQELLGNDASFFVSMVNEGTSILTMQGIPKKMILGFGNEGSGISPKLQSLAEKVFTIPMNNDCDSLNINAAVALSLFAFKNITRYNTATGRKNKNA